MWRIYLSALVALWLVIAVLLSLQFFLNALKYQKLIVDASAQQMQITAGKVETSLLRAERVGLSINEIQNLETILSRELNQSDLAQIITVMDPSGQIIASAAKTPSDPTHMEAVFAKLAAREDLQMVEEIQQSIITATIVLDSGSSIMGVILISASRDVYADNLGASSRLLALGYVVLFVALGLLVIPFLFGHASSVNKIVRVTQLALNDDITASSFDRPHQTLIDQVKKGKHAFYQAKMELDAAEQSRPGA